MGRWTSYNLLFFIKRTKILKNGKASLFLKITVNKKSVEFVLKCTIDPNLWSKEMGAARGSSKDAKQVNEFINAAKFRFQSIINELTSNGQEISCDNLKSKFLGIKPTAKTILGVFNDHNKKMTALVGLEFSQFTLQKYLTSYKHLKEFINKSLKSEDIEISKIDYTFLSDFEFFLKKIKKCGHNTTMKYLGNLKKIIRIAVNNDWLKKDPYANYTLSWKKSNRDYLSEEEIDHIVKKCFTIQRLEIVKDCFLFACYTGLAHSDLKRLTKENLITGTDNKLWISIKRKKTNVQSNIPLLPVAKAIIDKYKDHPIVLEKGVLLPVNSNQKMNAYLKEIADLCGINKSLTSHVARHTFATTITLNNDVPIESVSKMLGHSSLEMTRIYARILDKKVGRDMEHIAEKYSV